MNLVDQQISLPCVRLDKISLRYNEKSETILKNFSLEVERGEILGVFGTNGCGKSSLLNVLAGFVTPQAGFVHISGNPAKVSYLPQSYDETLLPWFTARKNLTSALEFSGATKEEREANIKELVGFFGDLVDLSKRPYELSGGQRQILAMLRCFVQKPDLILMDEPFSAINFHKMFALRQKIAGWAKKMGHTMIIVSHNLDDLAIVCDRIVAVAGPPLEVVTETTIELNHPRRELDLAGAEIIKAKANIYSHLKDV